MQAESGSVLVRGILHLVGQDAYFALISLQADIRTCVELGMRVTSRTHLVKIVLGAQLVKSVFE